MAPGQRAADRRPDRFRRGAPTAALAEQRERLLPAFTDDIALLSELTGDDYSDWTSGASRGSYAERAAAAAEEEDQQTVVTRSWAPSGRAASV